MPLWLFQRRLPAARSARSRATMADGIAKTAAGGVGVIVWDAADAVTGLEIHAMEGEDPGLPAPDSIRSSEDCRKSLPMR